MATVRDYRASLTLRSESALARELLRCYESSASFHPPDELAGAERAVGSGLGRLSSRANSLGANRSSSAGLALVPWIE